MSLSDSPAEEPRRPVGALETTRRTFLKFVVTGTGSLIVGVTFMPRKDLLAQEGPDIFDVGDFIILSEEPYATNLLVEVTPHNRVRFELPRLDKGQGIMTACAMLIADEMDADYERTDVELSDMRVDRPNSITGYSCTIRSMWDPLRTICADLRARLITAAANRWEILDASTLTTSKSLVIAPDGRRANYGELVAEADDVVVPLVPTTPKDPSLYALVGSPQPRKNARDIVTGQQQYTLDRDLPNMAHAVVARPPDLFGTVASVDDSALAGMTHVFETAEATPKRHALIPQIPPGTHDALEGGVAVVARTFQEAFDARDALVINWNAGPLNQPGNQQSDAELRQTLLDNAQPLQTPPVPDATLDASYDYPYVNHAPLEVQTAVADFQGDSVEVWFATQTPLLTAQVIARRLGFPEEEVEQRVTVHVPPCGGSFGRHLFSEAAVEAALLSKAYGRPIKVMWSRNDDMRNSRFRPMSHSDIRATWDPVAGNLLTYEHNLSADETDFKHGLGEAASAAGFDLAGNQLNQTVFEGSVTIPYDFAQKDQRLTETVLGVPTCSWRSIYSGYTVATNEMFIDELARAMGEDEVQFRVDHLTHPRAVACLQHVAAAAGWPGASLPTGHAYGVAAHVEYRSAVAYLVEIDASTPADPRLVNAWIAVDLGIPINPRGAQAQLQGALMDGFSVMLRAGNHVDNGRIREGSYGDFLWARMNHSPFQATVHVFTAAETGATEPGGCGELGLPPAAAACANAYNRATGSNHRQFPILEFV